MKVVAEKIVRTEEEASDVRFEGIRIGRIAEDLTVRLSNVSPENDDGRLEIFFANKENDLKYKMRISKEGVMFERVKYRPNHDHSDIETLAVRVDDSRPGPKKGTMQWLSSLEGGWEPYYVAFGTVRDDY